MGHGSMPGHRSLVPASSGTSATGTGLPVFVCISLVSRECYPVSPSYQPFVPALIRRVTGEGDQFPVQLFDPRQVLLTIVFGQHVLDLLNQGADVLLRPGKDQILSRCLILWLSAAGNWQDRQVSMSLSQVFVTHLPLAAPVLTPDQWTCPASASSCSCRETLQMVVLVTDAGGDGRGGQKRAGVMRKVIVSDEERV